MDIIGPEEAKALTAIVETGSYKAAARKLHKVQSALSYAIKKLEQNLGFKIFEKNQNQIKLSNAGKIVYNKVLSIIKINQEIEKFTNVLNQGIESKLTVAVAAVTPIPILINILQQFNCQFPQTQIELKITTFEEPLDYLMNGEADLSISSSNESPANTEKIHWTNIEFLAVASTEHPASLDGINEEDLLTMVNLVVGGRKTFAKKNPVNLSDNANIWHLTDFLLKKEFLLHGLGWGYMPKMLITRELSEGLLVEIKAKNIMRKELFLSKRKDQIQGPAAIMLWKLFINYAEAQLC